ncbi:MAG: L-threonylcarbamoyladenylate synthase [Halioglobus sp.]
MFGSFAINRAVETLILGGVIAYPTESVWGLGCDPFDEAAVMRLLELKRRPVGKGLILVAGSEAHLGNLLSGLDEASRTRLRATWPGPTTWLLPHRNLVPEWIHGDHDTVAVRVSAHPVVGNLCNAFGGLLVSTSANRAGAVAARHRFQVKRYFGEQLDYIVPGAAGTNARPSQILDLASGQTLRN